MVRSVRLELTRCYPLASETSLSAISTRPLVSIALRSISYYTAQNEKKQCVCVSVSGVEQG